MTRSEAPTLVGNNRALYRMLVEGVEVEYRRPLPLPPRFGSGPG
ncbi:MAG TPA: hypothetical protein VFD42_10020 [Chloroflexota bacterium]|nr:hypothetical protein [Chloroflexota bacterium]